MIAPPAGRGARHVETHAGTSGRPQSLRSGVVTALAVALTAASNAIGTCPDVAAITARAHEAGALTYVDAAHAAPHLFLDQAALGADFLAVSEKREAVGYPPERPGDAS